jgi:hypothetical protein
MTNDAGFLDGGQGAVGEGSTAREADETQPASSPASRRDHHEVGIKHHCHAATFFEPPVGSLLLRTAGAKYS